MIKEIIIVLLLVYALIVSYLLYDEYQNREKYFKDRSEYIDKMTQYIASKERELLEREKCDRELKSLKKVHRDALDILLSYNRYDSVTSNKAPVRSVVPATPYTPPVGEASK